MLKDQLQEVEKRIQAACDRAGRKREEVTLIAVRRSPLRRCRRHMILVYGFLARIKYRN